MTASLLPIVPILLLPFALVFFVVVFPIWGIALVLLGLMLVLTRGVDKIARMAGVTAVGGVVRGIAAAFRWVKAFGGLVRSAE